MALNASSASENRLRLGEPDLLELDGTRVGQADLHADDLGGQPPDLGLEGGDHVAEVVDGASGLPPELLKAAPVPDVDELAEPVHRREQGPIHLHVDRVVDRDVDPGTLLEDPAVKPLPIPLLHLLGEIHVRLRADPVDTVQVPGGDLDGPSVTRVPDHLPPGLEDSPPLLQGDLGIPDLPELSLGHPRRSEVRRGVVREEGRQHVNI
jgi:hypothetical protein